MLINPQSNWIVAGERFNLKAEDVIEFCRQGARSKTAPNQGTRRGRSAGQLFSFWHERCVKS